MRIGLVIHQFDPHRGGAERWTHQLAEHALRAGHDVHVVAHTFGHSTLRMGIVPHPVPKVRSPLAFATAAERTLRPLQLDLIHDMGCGWHFDILQPHDGSRRAQFERKLMGVAAWQRPLKRGLSRLLPRYRQYDALSARQFADHRRMVIALSRMVARDLERVQGWPLERSWLIYNGVDLDRFHPAHAETHRGSVRRRLGVADEELLVLFIAHNFELKGLAAVVRAVGRLAQNKVAARLVVLGGKRPGAYARLARRHGASVTFLGSVEDTVPFYAAADVFALPTWYDSCSLVVLEALASGLPVITSSHNGAAELMTDGVEGYVLADPGDWRQLSRHLESLFAPSHRLGMARAARKLASRHALADNCRQVLDLYDRAVGRVRRAA